MASDDRQEASSMEENEGHNSHKKYTSPFSQFDISPTHVLDTIQKMHCPTCNRNVRYFCNRCLHLVNCPDGAIPQVKLPIKIDIIKHEKERDGKSTALHAKILAPDDVQVYGWKSKPDYDQDVDRLLLLFPGPDAKRLSEIDPSSFDKLVVIDGTWSQAKMMTLSKSPLLRMKRVTIEPHETLFWRYQKKADDYLATIEAIYYFLREYHETYLSAPPEPIVVPSSPSTGSSVTATANSTSLTTTTTTTTATQSSGPEKVEEDKSVVGSGPVAAAGDLQTETADGVSKKMITPHKEWIDSRKFGSYTNQYDDILWFYKYFYELIQKSYRERTDGKEFTLKHKKDYIRYDVEDDDGMTASSSGSASAPAPAVEATAATATATTAAPASESATREAGASS
ncbi:DTW domain-containing protein 1 [Mortierella sp. GBA43]|nr:DTW domain-containing protein 1 [Mortierella sp. GBA43]